MSMFNPDVIVIGAGFAGSVMAERFSKKGKKVLLIEKRNHLGGNCYDYLDKNGIFIQKYGPHIFHTKDKTAYDYLSNFTEWVEYEHEVLANVNNKNIHIPFNLNSLYELFDTKKAEKLEKKLLDLFNEGEKIPVLKLKELAEKKGDGDLIELANLIFEKIFLNYSLKQWGIRPEELIGVTERVPILLSKDNRYFAEPYQGMPKEGYFKIFEKMLDNKNIKILLNTDYKKIIEIKSEDILLFGEKWEGTFVYSGKIDEFFDFKHGKLPYRSLKLEFKEENEEFIQENSVINYPSAKDFTRITEFKHFYKNNPDQNSIKKTVFVTEYPCEHNSENIPYYPIPQEDNFKKLELYNEELKKYNSKGKSKIIFIGRLAEYKYYNIDNIIKVALEKFNELD